MFIPRYIQLATQAYLFSLLMVVCWPVDSRAAAFAETVKQGQQQGIATEYTFFHRCSSKNLVIYGKKIRTSAKPDYAVMVSKTYHSSVNDYNSTIYIKSKKSNAYLCFSKKGRLHTRYDFNKDYCTFQEIMDENHYTQLQQRNWKVGFNKSGHPFNGTAYNKRPIKCFQFMKDATDGKSVKSSVNSHRTEAPLPEKASTHGRRHGHHKDREDHPKRNGKPKNYSKPTR